MKLALNPQGQDREQVKLISKLVEKLKYCKEVLTNIQAASGKDKDGASGLGEGEDQNLVPEPHLEIDLMRRGSKASLR